MSNTHTERTAPSSPLLDHLIDAALDAIKRARAAWLLGVIITFVFGVAVFNAVLSWNDSQIERRAMLYGASVEGIRAVKKLVESDEAIRAALEEGIGELGYLKRVWTACKATRDVSGLRKAIFSDLDSHVRRGVTFDTVGLPVISAAVTGSDYGIVGGVALIIVGYWLLAMIRREHLAFSEFLRIDEKSGQLVQGRSAYKGKELFYACQRIKHYMVFSVSEGGSPLQYVTNCSFAAAPLLLVVNHLLTAIDMTEKGLGGYIHWSVIVELLVVIVAAVVWIKALLYQHQTMRLMQFWATECESAEPFRKYDRAPNKS